jgi:4-alpha-glucanotransferase
MRIQFYLHFRTSFGQSLWISDNGALGTDLIKGAIPMTYLNEEFWVANIKIDKEEASSFHYKYILRNENGEIIPEFGKDRLVDVPGHGVKEVQLIDTWNHAGEYENVFYSAPFANILLKRPSSKSPAKRKARFTHVFKVKAPLMRNSECVCIGGSAKTLGEWQMIKPVLLNKEGNWWTGRLDLSEEIFPVAYKYGVYNKKEKRFLHFESGDNRIVHAEAEKKKITLLHDGFIHLPNNTWKGAGVAIPVFSLRSKKSFGVGEFTDLKLLADWAKTVGLRLIQILPVNDTIANQSWSDSYPYAAISAFALHPLYINLEKVAGKTNSAKIRPLVEKQQQLNKLSYIDYVEVVKTKLEVLNEIFQNTAEDFFDDEDYKEFFSANKYWLTPYAAFSYLRDKYQTSDFSKWELHSVYNKKAVEKLSSKDPKAAKKISFHYFVQYHLHKQLQEAADYCHKKGIVLKGDIPIGVYRFGCDTWVDPNLYNMDTQAGAPPDDFAVKGQNWGFPTYNWKKMQEDHFEWWRRRFEQMSNYFDAFRIDHVLGFFRIWSIPVHAVEGIMGHFVPAIPVHVNEFGERGMWFHHDRFCKPYINDAIVDEVFGDLAGKIKGFYLIRKEYGLYDLRPEYDTQIKVEAHVASLEAGGENERLRTGLFDLISNVILFEEQGSEGKHFHFRIAAENTLSFRYLEDDQKRKLHDLYVNYFFQRQDDFWMKEAMHKLPYLKRATNMLICGEDLGMVPHCVPDVMQQLGILSLEIQRMPKKAGAEFFQPAEAPYLSVITPSTHDMSTIRGWWEEDKKKITAFYHQVLGHFGDPSYYCEPWINRAIVIQHLYSPAMWSIFQLQDILGMSETLRRENPHEERINVPADPNNQWKYRMHLLLEDLANENDFNEELRDYILSSGR